MSAGVIELSNEYMMCRVAVVVGGRMRDLLWSWFAAWFVECEYVCPVARVDVWIVDRSCAGVAC